jgi:hypothetical protein
LIRFDSNLIKNQFWSDLIRFCFFLFFLDS